MNNLYTGSHAWLGEWLHDSLWALESERYRGLVVRSTNIAWFGLAKYLDVVAGEQYTFSCYVKIAAPVEVNIYLYHVNDVLTTARFKASQRTFYDLPVSVWTRISITAECIQSGTIRPRTEARTDGVKLSVCGYQLEVGQLTDYSLPLITDRSAADISNLIALTKRIKAGTATTEEIQQFLTEDNKGAYNASDLNRVEGAVRYLAEELRKIGYPANLVIHDEWTKENKPNTEDLKRYFENVAKIRTLLPAVYASTPEPPNNDLSKFNYEKANDLEKILLDIEEIMGKIADSWFYLGDLYLGEV